MPSGVFFTKLCFFLISLGKFIVPYRFSMGGNFHFFFEDGSDKILSGHEEKHSSLIFVLKEISFQMEGFFDSFPPYGLQ